MNAGLDTLAATGPAPMWVGVTSEVAARRSGRRGLGLMISGAFSADGGRRSDRGPPPGLGHRGPAAARQRHREPARPDGVRRWSTATGRAAPQPVVGRRCGRAAPGPRLGALQLPGLRRARLGGRRHRRRLRGPDRGSRWTRSRHRPSSARPRRWPSACTTTTTSSLVICRIGYDQPPRSALTEVIERIGAELVPAMASPTGPGGCRRTEIGSMRLGLDLRAVPDPRPATTGLRRRGRPPRPVGHPDRRRLRWRSDGSGPAAIEAAALATATDHVHLGLWLDHHNGSPPGPGRGGRHRRPPEPAPGPGRGRRPEPEALGPGSPRPVPGRGIPVDGVTLAPPPAQTRVPVWSAAEADTGRALTGDLERDRADRSIRLRDSAAPPTGSSRGQRHDRPAGRPGPAPGDQGRRSRLPPGRGRPGRRGRTDRQGLSRQGLIDKA